MPSLSELSAIFIFIISGKFLTAEVMCRRMRSEVNEWRSSKDFKASVHHRITIFFFYLNFAEKAPCSRKIPEIRKCRKLLYYYLFWFYTDKNIISAVCVTWYDLW